LRLSIAQLCPSITQLGLGIGELLLERLRLRLRRAQIRGQAESHYVPRRPASL